MFFYHRRSYKQPRMTYNANAGRSAGVCSKKIKQKTKAGQTDTLDTIEDHPIGCRSQNAYKHDALPSPLYRAQKSPGETTLIAPDFRDDFDLYLEENEKHNVNRRLYKQQG